MAGKKSLSPSAYHKKAQKRATKVASNAKKRAQSYSKGDKLVKQVSKTLNKLATSHPNPKLRKQAKRAVSQLKQAHEAFGSASMCMEGPTFNGDES